MGCFYEFQGLEAGARCLLKSATDQGHVVAGIRYALMLLEGRVSSGRPRPTTYRGIQSPVNRLHSPTTRVARSRSSRLGTFW